MNADPLLTPPSSPVVYDGEVIYIYAFDVAYEMERGPQQTLLGQPVQEYALYFNKRCPRQPFFYRPGLVQLPAQTIELDQQSIDVRCTVKIFNIGAMSLCIQVPFREQTWTGLVDFHGYGNEEGAIGQLARQLGGTILADLAPRCIKAVEQLGPGEAYTVFHLQPDHPLEIPAIQWLDQQRRVIAALLTEESESERLSQQEIDESTQYSLSYYDQDLVVIDWDAALLLAEPEDAAEIVHIMEVANVQLLELGVYDRLLDGASERAYRDVARLNLRSSRAIHKELREIRVDLSRLSDELSNITKFFGDWHLARLYQALYSRFHLEDWQKTTDQKQRTLADLYHLIQQDRTDLFMVTMEAAIVVLFIIDVIVILFHG